MTFKRARFWLFWLLAIIALFLLFKPLSAIAYQMLSYLFKSLAAVWNYPPAFLKFSHFGTTT